MAPASMVAAPCRTMALQCFKSTASSCMPVHCSHIVVMVRVTVMVWVRVGLAGTIRYEHGVGYIMFLGQSEPHLSHRSVGQDVIHIVPHDAWISASSMHVAA